MLHDMYVSEGLSREFNEVAKDTKISTKVNTLNSGFSPLTKISQTFKYPQRFPAQSSHTMISFLRSMITEICNGILVPLFATNLLPILLPMMFSLNI